MSNSEYKRAWYNKNKVRILKLREEYRRNNKEKANSATKKWCENNRAYLAKYKKSWANKNYEKNLLCRRASYRRNKSVKRASVAYRRAQKLLATPRWLDTFLIEEIKHIYKTCPPGFHVDHIVPLVGKNVSGLHVPWNLRHLSAKQNMIKGNRYEEEST